VEVFEKTNAPLLTPEYIMSLQSERTQDWKGDGKTLTIHDGIDIVPELEMMKEGAIYVPIFIELEGGNKSLGRHRDANEVLFVQCHGVTHWVVEDFYHKETYEVTLEPSDALYMPKAFFHHVTTLEAPRVGLSMIVG
jgi:hypothetical protein